MCNAELLKFPILKYESYSNAATPSAPQINPMTVLISFDLVCNNSCSSEVKVNPHGLRVRVLYLRRARTFLFKMKKGGT